MEVARLTLDLGSAPAHTERRRYDSLHFSQFCRLIAARVMIDEARRLTLTHLAARWEPSNLLNKLLHPLFFAAFLPV